MPRLKPVNTAWWHKLTNPGSEVAWFGFSSISFGLAKPKVFIMHFTGIYSFFLAIIQQMYRLPVAQARVMSNLIAGFNLMLISSPHGLTK